MSEDVMYGDWADEILDAIKPQTVFHFKFVDIKHGYDLKGEEGRNSVSLKFEVTDDGNPDHEPYIGMQPAPVWITYWTSITSKEAFDLMEENDQKIWKMSRQNLKLVARALGFSEEEIKGLTPQMFDEKVGTIIAGKVYRNEKMQQDNLDMKTLAPANLVDV